MTCVIENRDLEAPRRNWFQVPRILTPGTVTELQCDFPSSNPDAEVSCTDILVGLFGLSDAEIV